MSKGTEPRIHHWVPQCYLKGFAKSRSKRAQLYVIDAIKCKVFTSITRNVAAARDFNRIDIPELAPNLFESGLSSFEGQADNALKQICVKRDFSNEEDRAYVFNLIALLAVRNPRMRESSRQFQEDICKKLMGLTVATQERYESSLSGAKKDGFVSSDVDITYEQVRDFVTRGEYKIEVPTTQHVFQEIRSVDTILPFLFQRKWTLIIAEAGCGGFVTSDHPVVLQWSDAKARGAFYPPGFGLSGTEVIFPLSHNLVLVGTFEGQEAVIRISAKSVAAINGIVIAHGHRQIYARDNKFRYMITDGVLRHGSDVLSDLAKYRNKQE